MRDYRRWTEEEDRKILEGAKELEGRTAKAVRCRTRLIYRRKTALPRKPRYGYSERELAMIRCGIVPPGRPQKSVTAKARAMGLHVVFSERLWKPCEIAMLERYVCPRNRSVRQAYAMRRARFGAGDGQTKHVWKMESPAAFRERMK